MAQTNVDVAVRVKGSGDVERLTQRIDKLERELAQLQGKTGGAANAVKRFGAAARGAGASARGAAGGVKAFGVAVKSVLGPIAAVGSAVAGLGAAFKTISQQDFAEAKVRTLGVESDKLVQKLKGVSNELQGQASVVELTAASYDVASAGFNSAAEASEVLAAASKGAVGGFSDINTVANATTSVLNAYQQSSAQAAQVVDQFIQTQNDGKIVVAEYARNIGKVASAAAGLGVPLSEVNAVIAQSTASGVQAEVAFTGLKTALARLASGEAEKALKGTGIEISAASVKSEGLYKTLKKLEGLDTGQIFKALGTEAGPALLPVIQNLEKYKDLLENQEQANGTAAEAARQAADTIQGAWKRVTTAVQNLFSDQSELGQAIKLTFMGVAATIEALGAAFTLLMTPIRALTAFIGEVAAALTGLQSGGQVIQALTDQWFANMRAVQEVAQTVQATGQVIGQYVGALIQEVTGWFSGLWTSISEGVQGVYGAITGVFAQAFNAVKGIIDGFWNSLPDWLKGALSAAGDVAGGVYNAVAGALNKVGGDIQKAKGALAAQSSGGGAPGAFNAVVPTAGALGGGSGGGGGGAGAVAKENAELQRKLELINQIKLAQQQETLDLQTQLMLQQQQLAAIEQYGFSEAERMAKRMEAEQAINAATQERLQKLYDSQAPAEQIQETERLILEEMEKQKAIQAELIAGAEQLAAAADKHHQSQKGATGRAGKGGGKGAGKSLGQEMLGTLKGGLGNVISTAIKGGDVKAAMEQLLGQILDKMINHMLDMLFAPLEQALAGPTQAIAQGGQQMAQAGADVASGAAEQVSAAAEGAASAAMEQASAGQMTGAATQQVTAASQMITAAAQQMAAAQMMAASGGFGFFAEGGRPDVGQYALVGERGPEIVKFDQPATVYSNEESRQMQSAMDKYSPSGEGGAGAAAGGGGNTEEADMDMDSTPITITTGPVMQFEGKNYVTQEEFAKGVNNAAKQGEERALRKLQYSPSSRRRIGLK